MFSPCNRILTGHINLVWCQAHIPEGDTINSEAEDLLVPVFMTLNLIPEAYVERVPNWFVTCCAINTVKLHVVCSKLCRCSKSTLAAASTVTRLCWKRCTLFRRVSKNLFTIFKILNNKLFLTLWSLRVRSNILSCFIRKFYINSVSHHHESYKVNCEMTYLKLYTKQILKLYLQP